MKYIYGLTIFFLILLGCICLARDVNAQPELKSVEVTAYYDYHHKGIGADGRRLVEGLTIAGKREWLGYTIALYDLDYKLIGLYEVRDTGYGQSIGYGQSKILKGRCLGDIETGMTLDLYFSTYRQCLQWGRRKCYMQLIKAVG